MKGSTGKREVERKYTPKPIPGQIWCFSIPVSQLICSPRTLLCLIRANTLADENTRFTKAKSQFFELFESM